MNQDYVNEISVEQFRLRTARQKKRLLYKDREKQLRAISREQNALYKQQRSLGWMELKPPVMRGYKRYFVLRSDMAKSKHAAFYEGILAKINTTQYSSRKDFKTKKRKPGKRLYIANEQTVRSPDAYHFKKMDFTDAEKLLFEEIYAADKWTGKPTKIFVFTEAWRFVLQVRPNMITKTRVRDEAIESRLQQISNYLERNALRGTLGRFSRGRSYYKCDGEKPRYKHPFTNMPLHEVLRQYGEVESEE